MCLAKWASPAYDTVDPRNAGHMAKTQVCTSRAQENCTGLGIAVLKYHQGRKYRRLYGRVRCGPLRWMRDPTLKLTLTLYPGPHAAAR